MSNEDREGTTCPTCKGTRRDPGKHTNGTSDPCTTCGGTGSMPYEDEETGHIEHPPCDDCNGTGRDSAAWYAPCPSCGGDGHARLVGANPPDLGIHEGGCHTCDGAGTAPEVTFGEFTCLDEYAHWVVVDDLWACAGDAGSRSECEQGRCSGPHHKLILGPKVEI